MRTRDILSRPVVTVRPETPLADAITMLTEHGFAALPVVDDQDRVIGMLSEHDALAVTGNRRTASVEAVMAVPAEVVTPATDVSVIAERMLTKHLRSLPVVESGVLVGIVARRDVLRALLHDDTALESKIRDLLDDYAGSRRRWTIAVAGNRAVIRGDFTDPGEQRIIAALARSVAGIDHVDTVQERIEYREPAHVPIDTDDL